MSTERQIRKRSCGICENCNREDCKTCAFCLDRKKYGGPATLKQRCSSKRCEFKVLREGPLVSRRKRSVVRMKHAEQSICGNETDRSGPASPSSARGILLKEPAKKRKYRKRQSSAIPTLSTDVSIKRRRSYTRQMQTVRLPLVQTTADQLARQTAEQSAALAAQQKVRLTSSQLVGQMVHYPPGLTDVQISVHEVGLPAGQVVDQPAEQTCVARLSCRNRRFGRAREARLRSPTSYWSARLEPLDASPRTRKAMRQLSLQLFSKAAFIARREKILAELLEQVLSHGATGPVAPTTPTQAYATPESLCYTRPRASNSSCDVTRSSSNASFNSSSSFCISSTMSIDDNSSLTTYDSLCSDSGVSSFNTSYTDEISWSEQIVLEPGFDRCDFSLVMPETDEPEARGIPGCDRLKKYTDPLFNENSWLCASRDSLPILDGKMVLEYFDALVSTQASALLSRGS